MVSLRKRYRTESREDAPPVSTAPSGGHPRHSPTETDVAKPVETLKPAEQLATESPADQAAKSAMRERLQETERAAAMQHETPQQPQYAEAGPHEPPTVEQIIEATQLPERAKRWLRQYSEYILDPAKNQTLIALHPVAQRQAGSEFTDMYFEKMEDLLGLKPATQQSRGGNGAQQTNTRAAPVRQQYSGPPAAAPPHRDVPSMTTGRPQNFRGPMTAAERDIARASGISDEQYQQGKERMLKEKSAGLHGNG
jgi:hypothetical protein